jgi:hypothetical protein
MRGARIRGGLAVLAVAAGALSAVRCGYSPDFPSGTLHCSTVQSCPEGYSCDKPSNLCYKHGESPSGAAGASGATGQAGAGGAGGHGGAAGATGVAGTGGATGLAGMGGSGGMKGPSCAGSCVIKIDGPIANGNPPSVDSKFVGHWVFQVGSTETVSCSDGSSKTTDLSKSGPPVNGQPTADFVDLTLSGGTLNASYFCDWLLNVGPAGNATVIRQGQSCSRNINDPTTGVTHFTWHGGTFTLRTDDSKTGTLGSMIPVDYVDDPLKTGCTP